MTAPQTTPLRVLLAVPETPTCAKLKAELAICTGVRIVGKADRESEAMRLFFRMRPEVLVVDWRIAEHEPARLVGLLKRVSPGTCAVAVVPGVDSMPARAARALGADHVVVAADLPDCLERIAADAEARHRH
ncbi:two-component system response regulator [Azoarcus indigens]|nr:two-component system response regulator [Azoarcus indigens]